MSRLSNKIIGFVGLVWWTLRYSEGRRYLGRKLRSSKMIQFAGLLIWVLRYSQGRQYLRRKLRLKLEPLINILFKIKSRIEEVIAKHRIQRKLKKISFKSAQKNRDFVIVTAFTGRHSILRAMIEFLNNHLIENNGSLILVGSTKEDTVFGKQLAKQYPYITYATFPNQPLGAKWQFAVELAREQQPKAIVIIGSDDLVSENFIRLAAKVGRREDEFAKQKIGLCGFRAWYLYDISNEESNFSNTLWQIAYNQSQFSFTLGAGRIYTREFLDANDWQLFELTWRSNLDNRGETEVKNRGFSIIECDVRNFPVLSIKGPWNMMNTTEAILMSETIHAFPHDFTWDLFLEKHFPTLREKLSGTVS